MMRSVLPFFAAVFVLFLSVALPLRAADAPAMDVTQRFVQASAGIEDLRAIDVSGILVLRGRTTDLVQAEEVGRLARSLGYQRVANLIQITGPVDDEKIERLAERELAIHRSLEGCRFVVDSQGGVVRLAGQVKHDAQIDYALQLVRSIDGVKRVYAVLRR